MYELFLYVRSCSTRVQYPLLPEEGTRFLGPGVNIQNSCSCWELQEHPVSLTMEPWLKSSFSFLEKGMGVEQLNISLLRFVSARALG